MQSQDSAESWDGVNITYASGWVYGVLVPLGLCMALFDFAIGNRRIAFQSFGVTWVALLIYILQPSTGLVWFGSIALAAPPIILFLLRRLSWPSNRGRPHALAVEPGPPTRGSKLTRGMAAVLGSYLFFFVSCTGVQVTLTSILGGSDDRETDRTRILEYPVYIIATKSGTPSDTFKLIRYSDTEMARVKAGGNSFLLPIQSGRIAGLHADYPNMYHDAYATFKVLEEGNDSQVIKVDIFDDETNLTTWYRANADGVQPLGSDLSGGMGLFVVCFVPAVMVALLLLVVGKGLQYWVGAA